ncbi:MAG TPA: PPOX class F420-dependent oxidoreductase [Actinophytocola sp.]|uniref:PPOX class F420-dependent oxidoreductase n=1 Tax=Actinophytocola sp. TaxID=1872138 RepID=UPI002DDD8AF4|nr:PPOX class F420-dependent oxidoreductase [Actinophytocola sp.]HEV2784003.1 PPOX class F420-dependent oxidoreductase [Actinophytocola sp.]
MASEMDRLAAGKYLLVTTFRKSGAAVATPVWVARDGDELVVWSAVDAGKVKRIRNNPAVEVAACDLRGRPSGAAVKAVARVLDAEGSERVRRLLRAKYGVMGWVSVTGSVIRRGKRGTVGIAIRLT